MNLYIIVEGGANGNEGLSRMASLACPSTGKS